MAFDVAPAKESSDYWVGRPGQESVAVLLCSYQGYEFLRAQLDSIAAQIHPCWQVWASDDGSTDATLDLLRAFQSRLGVHRVSIRSGPQRGSAANFLSLACNPEISADYYAYADQDDVWDADKLTVALAWLRSIPADVPAMYCGRTRLIDAQGRPAGYSPLFTRPAGFANALVQNIGGGNTMVFNDAARRLLVQAGPDVPVALHDWWTYLVVTACGGRVHYDPQPHVAYRQHDGNQIGNSHGWAARLARWQLLCEGRLRRLNEQNIAALQRLRGQLTPDNQRLLDAFAEARYKSLVGRLVGIKRAGLYRQTSLGNLSLFAATVLGKI